MNTKNYKVTVNDRNFVVKANNERQAIAKVKNNLKDTSRTETDFAGAVRELCIKNNWYTAGDTDAYSKMLNGAKTNWTLSQIAMDIAIHSDKKDVSKIKNALKSLPAYKYANDIKDAKDISKMEDFIRNNPEAKKEVNKLLNSGIEWNQAITTIYKKFNKDSNIKDSMSYYKLGDPTDGLYEATLKYPQGGTGVIFIKANSEPEAKNKLQNYLSAHKDKSEILGIRNYVTRRPGVSIIDTNSNN